jgi:hypothetical protein
LSFLAGPHACIGYRFSLLECVLPTTRCHATKQPCPARMKILLHALVTAFNFELAVPVEEVVKVSGVVTRPALRDALQDGTQLPLVVSVADAE